MNAPLFSTVSQLLQKRYPLLQLDIRFMAPDQLVSCLTNFEINIGVTCIDNPTLDRLVTMALLDSHRPDELPLHGRCKTNV